MSKIQQDNTWFYVPDGFVGRPTTPLDVLKRARATIAEEGRWARYSQLFSRGKEPFCGNWKACARGALRLQVLGVTSTGEGGWRLNHATVVRDPGQRTLLVKATDLLSKARQALYPKSYDIVSVNDSSLGREAVLAIFDKAIADEEELEQARLVTHVEPDGRHKYLPINCAPPTTVVQVLRAARRVISDEGRWVQKTDFKNDLIASGEDVETPYCNGWGACARGAVHIVAIGMERNKPEKANPGDCNCEICSQKRKTAWLLSLGELGRDSALYYSAMNWLNLAAQMRGAHGIVDYNDKTSTTHQDVLRCFDEAIKMAVVEEKHSRL